MTSSVVKKNIFATVEKYREILLRHSCHVCKRVFTSQASLKRHNELYASPHFIYPCCGAQFLWSKISLNHSCNFTSGSKSVTSLQDFLETPEDDVDNYQDDSHSSIEKQTYKCNGCPAKFSRLQSVRSHILKYPDKHDYTCGQCKKLFFTAIALKKHLCILTNFTFQCSCNLCFASLQEFKLHIGPKRPYYCCACNQKSLSFNNLINHIRSHTKENTFKCDVCGKLFRVRESLKVHEKVHKGEKSFNCSKCSYSTSRKWNLRLHEKRHNPERNTDRQYLCSVCGSCFYLKHHLRRHVAIHNKERSHLCLICGKLFSQKAYLEKHLKNHKRDSKIGYNCVVCRTDVSKACLFQHHLETGHFEHVCFPCQKVFPTKFNLQRHVRNHNANHGT